MAGRKPTHGHCSRTHVTPTYHSWVAMAVRCRYPEQERFKDWGGRGITICERWKSFENFLADMGERPPGKTLDRIDNDGNYEPGNCHWVPIAENNRKRRNTKLTLDDIENIRALSVTFTQTWIAKLFEISRPHIGRIINGKAWQ